MGKNSKSIPISLKIQPEMYDMLNKLAISNNLNLSEQVREFIEKGLNVDGHKKDIDFISSIIRQELTAIYHVDDIQKIMESQTNRLAKMIMKSGKLSSAEFFLMLKIFMYLWDEKSDNYFDQLLNESILLGVDFMQKKDFKVNDFLYDTENLRDIAKNLAEE